jgi:hypothetical protein
VKPYNALTQADIERAIMSVSEQMEQATFNLAEIADDAAVAEADYKVAFARALWAKEAATEKLNVGAKDAAATIETEHELRARIISAAKLSVAQESLRTMRSRMDALRTVAANLRSMT